jgi:hypothetical protein
MYAFVQELLTSFKILYNYNYVYSPPILMRVTIISYLILLDINTPVTLCEGKVVPVL